MAASKTNLNCGSCNDTFSKVIMLECVHSFCRSCVESLIKASKGDKIVCPTCTSPSNVPSSGVDGFARNIHLDNQVKIASIRTKEDLECQRCKRTRKGDRKAIEFCKQCNRLLCKTCAENHEVELDYDDHERITIDEFKSGDVKIELPPGKCITHNEVFKWYCSGHNSLHCETCRIEEHSSCKVMGLITASSTEKEDLKKVVPGLKTAIDKLKQATEENENMRKKVQESKTKVDQEIDQCFNKLVQAIEVRRKTLKQKCADIAQDKDVVLASQCDETVKLKEEFVFLQDQVQNSTSHYTLEELLSVKPIMKGRASTRLEEFNSINLALKENEFIDMSIKEIDSIAAGISSIGVFGEVPEPANCSVEGLSLPDAAVGSSREFKVILRNEKNEIIKGKAAIQYTLEKAPGIPELQAVSKFTQLNGGMTTLSITPKVPGDLIITIKVRNVPLINCPFHMKVHQARGYDSLPNPKALNPLSSAGNCITISGEHVYVTTQNTVEVINANGDRLKTHQKSLSNPWGVVVIEREMYVTNRGTHDVRVYATAGEYFRAFGGNGSDNGQFNDPRGICSEGNERIFIADYGNSRVQVFNRKKDQSGKMKDDFFCSIPCSSNPIDVAVDASGKVHVALEPANQIEVFSWNGNNYESINKYNAGGAPTGVFVDVAGYRFVTQNTNNQLHIFDSSGSEVLVKPGCSGGVAVDSNGTVYTNTPNSAQVNKFCN